MTDPTRTSPERERTDQSLRTERMLADRALEDNIDALDEAADAVIILARARADAVLAAARAREDHSAQSQRPLSETKKTRSIDDSLLKRERVTADHILSEERASHSALLGRERDETDTYLSHERSRSDDALTAREAFMGSVSHDLHNMLNVLVGTASLIENEATQDPRPAQVITHARRLLRTGVRMRRLVGDLLDVASIEAGALGVTLELGDPTKVLTEAIDTFQALAANKGLTLVADVVAPLPQLAFDAARILQVLSNLIGNAIKFTPSPGSVVVRVAQVGEDVRFSVSDTGTGIPADKLEAVFERFVQLTNANHRGAGLGLYIAKCIVRGHAGRIWAEHRRGGGGVVCFTLPVRA